MSLPFLLIAALFALPVSMDVRPTFAMSPATFRAIVMVPRDAGNREICVGYTGNEDRRSCIQLDGLWARRVFTIYWSIRVAGEYEASATLTRMEDGTERRYRTVQGFRVIGMEP